MFESQPGQSQSRIDPFVIVLLVGLLATGGIVLLADKVVFIYGPRDFTDRILAVPTLISYNLTKDRVVANVTSFMVWGTSVACILISIYTLTMRYLIPRTMMKEMVQRELEEEELKNRFKREMRQRK